MGELRIKIEGESAEVLGNSFALSGTDHIERNEITEAIADWDVDSTSSRGALSDGPTIESLSLVVETTSSVAAQLLATWLYDQVSDDGDVSIVIDGESVEVSQEELSNAIKRGESNDADDESPCT